MVPLEILDSVILVANTALLIILLRRRPAAPQPTQVEEPPLVEKVLDAEPHDHWDALRFGGREEVAGKHRVILVCDKCNASRIVEEA